MERPFGHQSVGVECVEAFLSVNSALVYSRDDLASTNM